MWSEIEEQTQKNQSKFLSTPMLRWAATILLAGFVGVLYQYLGQNNLEYQTAFGEMRDVELEDGTMVHLNANSNLIVHRTWLAGFQREVDLKGEAFFEVAKKTENSENVTFRVNTSKSSIEVLGTQFNVNTWDELTEVVLTEGQVKVKANFSRAPILMSPGEKVSISDNQQFREKVNTLFYTDWMAGKWTFQDQSLRQIIAFLNQQYDISLRIEDKSLLEKHFSASVDRGDLTLLSRLIAETFDVKVIRESDDTFVIRRIIK